MRIPSTLNGVGRPRKFILFAAKLGEDAEGALGMEETDMESFGTATRLLVDEADALFFAFSESSVSVLNCKGDMVHATLATILLNEGGDGAFGTGGLEELDFHVTAAEESGLHFLVLNFFDGIALQTHNVLPVADSLVEVGHSNADVFNV